MSPISAAFLLFVLDVDACAVYESEGELVQTKNMVATPRRYGEEWENKESFLYEMMESMFFCFMSNDAQADIFAVFHVFSKGCIYHLFPNFK